MFCLPGIRTLRLREPVETPSEIVQPHAVVERFIHLSRHRWIMNRCIRRESSKCGDHPIGLGCLFMGDAALGIHPGFGRLVSQ
jgi:hypothetical protein